MRRIRGLPRTLLPQVVQAEVGGNESGALLRIGCRPDWLLWCRTPLEPRSAKPRLRLPVGLGEGVVEFAVSNGTPEGVGATPRVEGAGCAFEGEAGVPEFDSPAHDGCVDPGVGRWSKETGALHRAWNAPLAPAGETNKV